jgi:hypothetical protein
LQTGESRSSISWGRDVSHRFCEWIAVGRAADVSAPVVVPARSAGELPFTDVAMPGGMTGRQLPSKRTDDNRKQKSFAPQDIPRTQSSITDGSTRA